MIDVKSKRCVYEGCNKHPTFNLPTETKPLFCFEHKKENMVDIKHKRCVYEGCNKQPTFNLPTETKPLFCFEHKKENMINVKDKKCVYEGCNKRPNFNLPTETKPLFCFEHKKENMINVKDKKCVYEGCNKRPNFNLPTETKPLFCFEHKKENMVNVKSKRCQFNNCKEDAIYGLINKRAQFCFEHKKTNMINLILENKCSVPECDNEFEFIIDNQKYCLNHCPKDYETNIKRLCKYCNILENSKHICKDCKKVSNKKEWAIVRHLRKTIDTKFEYNSSKMLQGCSKKRPDIYFELNKHCVIVEVDEHQHMAYEESCECARINEIVNGIGGKSVILIRFNPDNTKNKGKKLKLNLSDKIDLLINKIKEELIKDYDTFIVKLIQIYFDDNYEIYQEIKEENLTNKVCI